MLFFCTNRLDENYHYFQVQAEGPIVPNFTLPTALLSQPSANSTAPSVCVGSKIKHQLKLKGTSCFL